MNIRPYEISLWEDVLKTVKQDSKTIQYIEEDKIAIIGSNTMTSLARVSEPQFTRNVNGELTLKFSIYYKYYDEEGNFVENPFIPYLVNERKVKLYYDNPVDNDKWFDFIIKEIEEDSDTHKFTYTCKSLYINELSKNGYNIELSEDNHNNTGTPEELGAVILEDTDWTVKDSDIIRQKVNEPLYLITVSKSFTLKNLLHRTNSEEDIKYDVQINAGDKILVFYSMISNQLTKNIQCILYSEDKSIYTFDDQGVADSINYFINLAENEITFANGIPSYCSDSKLTIFNDFEAKRLVYSQKMVYDSVSGQYVDIYKTIEQEGTESKTIYHYIDTVYTTSDVITNFITNNKNFKADGVKVTNDGITGWQTENGVTSKIATYPPVKNQIIATASQSISLNTSITNVKDYLQVNFAGNGTNYLLYNSGIFDNAPMIGGFSKGEPYALRIKYGYTTNADGAPANTTADGYKLNGIICEYEINGTTNLDYIPKTTYFSFTGTPTITNVIKGGFVSANLDSYYKIVDGTNINEVPNAEFYYEDSTSKKQYKWNFDTSRYELVTSSDLLFWKIQATCENSLAYSDLIGKKVGLFLYTSNATDSNGNTIYYDIEDIQLTKYCEDINGEEILLGEAPTASSIDNDVFYQYLPEVLNKEDLVTYASKDAIKAALGSQDIVPVYNENYEKILSVEGKQSNCFNLIQDVCEKFECWAFFNIQHESTGHIKLDSNKKPIKTVSFKNYSGKDNYAGFKYGINLNSIQRTINSNSIVSKLYVVSNSNENATGGSCSIQRAESNPSGEDYIYNFSYFINKGLVSGQEMKTALNSYYEKVKAQNNILQTCTTDMTNLSNNITKLTAKQTIYTEYYNNAASDLETEKKNFLVITSGTSYDNYKYTGTLPTETTTIDNIVVDTSLVTEVSKIITYQKLVIEYKNLLDEVNKELTNLTNKYTTTVSNYNTALLAKKQINKDFYAMYHRFIQEGTWNSDDYISDELYYLDGLKTCNTNAQPQVTYTLSAIDISMLENYDIFSFMVGEKTTVEDTEFFGYKTNSDGVKTPIKEEVIISELMYNLEEPSQNTITIQNYKTQFEDLFQRVTASVQTVEYKEGSYDRSANAITSDGHVDTQTFVDSFAEASAHTFELTTNQIVTTDNTGINIRDITSGAKRIRLTSSGIAFSSDGGTTWRKAVSSEGVYTDSLVAGTINTQLVTIYDGNKPALRWDNKGISAFRYNNTTHQYDNSTFVRFDSFGLYSVEDPDTSDPFEPKQDTDIINNTNVHFGILNKQFFIRNSYTNESGTKTGQVEIGSNVVSDIVISSFDDNGNPIKRLTIGAISDDASIGTAEDFGIKVYNKDGITTNLVISALHGITFTGSEQIGTGSDAKSLAEIAAILMPNSTQINGAVIAPSTIQGTSLANHTITADKLAEGAIDLNSVKTISSTDSFDLTAANNITIKSTKGTLTLTDVNNTTTLEEIETNIGASLEAVTALTETVNSDKTALEAEITALTARVAALEAK